MDAADQIPDHRANHRHHQPEMPTGKAVQLLLGTEKGCKHPLYGGFHLGDVGNGFAVDLGFYLPQCQFCAMGQGLSGSGHGGVDSVLKLAVAVGETDDLSVAVVHELTDADQSGVDLLTGLILLLDQCCHLLAVQVQRFLQHAVFQFQLVQVVDGLPAQDLRLVLRRGAVRL